MFLCNLLVSVTFLTSVISEINQDFSSNQVQIQFDLVEPFEWSDADILAFKKSLAAAVEKYCSTNQTACGMLDTGKFTADNVVIVGNLEAEYVNTVLRFAVRLPALNQTSGRMYVPQRVLAELVTVNRLQLQRLLLASSGQLFDSAFRVSFVDGVLILPESDQTLNRIITPITCAIVFVLILVIIGLEIKRHFHRKNKIERARDEARLAFEQKQKDSPVVNV